MAEESFIESSFNQEDPVYDVPLRPKVFSDFVGQQKVLEQLDVLISAAKKRKEPISHALFCGPPGLGKTTLAHIIAHAMQGQIVITSGPVIEKAGDLAGILTKLKKNDVLFIDEIHRLNRTIEEYLYPAMEDFSLDIVINSGANARSVSLKLERFTLIGATTRLGLISAPLRTRFGFVGRLEYYAAEVLQKILQRSSSLLEITADQKGLFEIAARSRGTPRIANHLLRWVRDYAQIKADGVITKEVAQNALGMLAIDEKGLDAMDSKILRVLIEHYKGGPVGVQTLAMAVGEEVSTLEEVYEPYLIVQGFLKRTPRGREATALAFDHIGYSLEQAGLAQKEENI